MYIYSCFLVIGVSAISNYRQNRQFDKLSKVSNNIQIEVMRDGRRQQISVGGRKPTITNLYL